MTSRAISAVAELLVGGLLGFLDENDSNYVIKEASCQVGYSAHFCEEVGVGGGLT